jgi:hypothetical protein
VEIMAGSEFGLAVGTVWTEVFSKTLTCKCMQMYVVGTTMGTHAGELVYWYPAEHLVVMVQICSMDLEIIVEKLFLVRSMGDGNTPDESSLPTESSG